jgi:LysM repeat protein
MSGDLSTAELAEASVPAEPGRAGWRRHGRVLRLAAVPLTIALIGTAAAGGAHYRVHSGDTLSGIAVDHHTTVDVLRSLNHIPATSDLIRVGQVLTLPAAAPRPTVPTPVTKPTTAAPTTKVVTYVVRSGDNLTAIARHYSVSIASIVTRNHLRADGMIFIAQHLQIAVPVSNGPTSFAGRTYPPATVAKANHHRAILAQRKQPSTATVKAMIVATAHKLGLDPALALAIGWQESGFQQRVVSPADAVGIMQVVPSTGDYISTYLVHRHLDLLDPADNITAGVALLKALTAAAPVDKAIAGYYQGIESVLAKGMYADTKAYVASVQVLRKHFAS